MVKRVIENITGWWTRNLRRTAWRLKRKEMVCENAIAAIRGDLELRDLVVQAGIALGIIYLNRVARR